MNSRWGKFQCEPSTVLQLTYGELIVEVQRDELQWLIGSKTESTDDLEFFHSQKINEKTIDEKLERFVVKTDEHIQCLPKLADLPMVVKPNIPFKLPAKNQCVLFVGTPVWLNICSADAQQTFYDKPIQRPSDSWFGPNTWEGELCYATKTRAFVELNMSLMSRHRAISTVTLVNKSTDTLNLERISLPVPNLSIYQDEEGMLWTENLTVTNERDSSMVTLQIDKIDKDHNDRNLLCGPRKRLDKNKWARTIGSILG